MARKAEEDRMWYIVVVRGELVGVTDDFLVRYLCENNAETSPSVRVGLEGESTGMFGEHFANVY